MDSRDNIKSKLISFSLIVFNLILYTVIFICLSFLFTIVHTEAQTINTNYFQIQSITQDWGVGQQSYSNYLIDYLNFTFGYQFIPVYTNQNNIPLLSSDYEIYTNYDIVINEVWPFIPTYQFQVYNNGWINATCDGQVEDNLISQTIQGTWTRYNFEYKCSLLNVNQDFTAVRFRIFDTQIANPRSTVEFQINSFNILDKNEISTGDQAIINNQNQNTDKIVKEQQETNEQLEELNDFFNNDTITNHSSIFGDINFNSTGAISGIITTPLSAIQSLTSNTCSDLVLPLPFVDEDLTLPCMTPVYTQYFGSFFTIYQTIILGITAYWVFLNIFKMVQGFADPMEDRIEVLDL